MKSDRTKSVKEGTKHMKKFILRGDIVFEARDVQDALLTLAFIFMCRFRAAQDDEQTNEPETLDGSQFTLGPTPW